MNFRHKTKWVISKINSLELIIIHYNFCIRKIRPPLGGLITIYFCCKTIN